MDKTFEFALPSPNFNKNAKDVCKPKPHFLTPSGMSLLPREKQPPSMYGKHGATVPPRYLRQHVMERQFVAAKEKASHSPAPEKQYCEPCELELHSLEDLKRHRAQHERCPVAGCQYKGHPTVIDKHINALHAFGLCDKFKKLNTPEEIAAWREERRKRYPTVANVLLKQKAQEQRQKRGERLEANKNRFGKVNDRKRAQPVNEKTQADNMKDSKDNKSNNKYNKKNRKNKRNQKNRNQELESKAPQQNNDVVEELNNETCGGIKMFMGTSQLKNYKHFNDKKAVANNALLELIGMYGSDDSDENTSDQESDDMKMEVVPIKANNEFRSDNTVIEIISEGNDDSINTIETDGNLKLVNETINVESTSLTTPNSTAENDISDNISKLESNENSAGCNDNSSDEAPEEAPIERCATNFTIKPEKRQNNGNEGPPAKRSKELDQATTTSRQKNSVKRKSGLDYRKARLRKQNTMLEKLLETDIRHERNVLLQCVRYVCENNFFGIGKNNQENPG